MKIHLVGAEFFRADGRTYDTMKKRTVIFHNFANATPNFFFHLKDEKIVEVQFVLGDCRLGEEHAVWKFPGHCALTWSEQHVEEIK
jgi:hypothetical protein